MPRKKSSVAGKKAKFAGFVNVYLSKEDKDAIRENLLPDLSIVEFIQQANELDYKFSSSQSADGKTYTCTLYGALTSNPNAGLAMSLRHSDFVVAISALSWVLREEGMKSSWEDRFSTVGNDDW